MKKGIWLVSTGLLLSFSSLAQAKQDICVFYLLGKVGESYKMMEEWALAAKGWNADVRLIAYQNEEKADNDFKNGKCDAIYMTTMRARAYNKFAGSIDALGGVPSNAIAHKAIIYVLDKRNIKRLKTSIDNVQYEVGGLGKLGLHIFL